MSLIVIEGADGTGKTSTTKRLADRLGYVTVKTPSKRYRLMRKKYDAPGVDVDERFNFYLEGLKDSMLEITGLLKSGVSGVVVDRYALSLGIYHSIMNPSRDYMKLVEEQDLLMPDVQFILCPSLNKIVERISNRYAARSDSHLEQDGRFMGNVAKRFEEVTGDNIYKINSSALNLDAVVESCVDKISIPERNQRKWLQRITV